MSRDAAKRLRDLCLPRLDEGSPFGQPGTPLFVSASTKSAASFAPCTDCSSGAATPTTTAGAEVEPTTPRSLCRLGDLWAQHDVVLCIFRRFGCPICRLGAASISALKPLFDARNIRLVGIGLDRSGLDGFRPYFAGELILLDANRDVYKALSLQTNSWRNLWGLLSGEVHRLIREVKKRKISGDVASGDASQMGGTLVLEKGSGKELYVHRQTNERYEPDLTALTAALCIRLPEYFDAYGYAATIASRLEAQQQRLAAEEAIARSQTDASSALVKTPTRGGAHAAPTSISP